MEPKEITLREYYAGLAMQGLLGNSALVGTEVTMQNIAEAAIMQADALISELQK